jgi:hypothetical protein
MFAQWWRDIKVLSTYILQRFPTRIVAASKSHHCANTNVAGNFQKMTFTIIASLILFGLTALCYWLPYKSGHKRTGLITSIILGTLVLLTIIGDLDFLVIFIWPIILAIQIIFITYWSFRLYNRKILALISSISLTIIFILNAMSPWISDWEFNKENVREILTQHDISLQGDFKIIKNESGGFRDYYETFTIEISQSDHSHIANKIRTAKNFRGLITDFPSPKEFDTLNYETENYLTREYYTQAKMNNGTYHFTLQLSKRENKLDFIGANE